MILLLYHCKLVFFNNKVNFFDILESSKLFWLLISLELEEFNFLFQKESLICFNKLFPQFMSLFFRLSNFSDFFKIIAFFEIKLLFNVSSCIIFSEDDIILRNHSNLTILEKELGFFIRYAPVGCFIENSNFINNFDSILNVSLFQRKIFKNKLYRLFNKLGRFYVFCNLRFKKIFNLKRS